MIRRSLLILCAAALLGACSDEDSLPAPALRLQEPSATLELPTQAGGEHVLHFSADAAWRAVAEGSGFEIRPAEGPAGAGSIALRTTQEYTATEAPRTLGRLVLRLEGAADSTVLTVVQRPRAVRTLLMYFSGTSLYANFRRNLLDVARALESYTLDRGRVVAFTQPSSDSAYVVEWRRKASDKTCRRDTLLRYGAEVCSADPETMTALLRAMMQAAPSDHYALHLGSHATGWIPAAPSYTTFGARPDAREALWRYPAGERRTRTFGSDKGRRMEIPDLNDALRETGVTFDYLLFDACLMSSVEALYALRERAGYIVASPAEVLVHGFPYDTAIPALLADGGRSFDLPLVCKRYHEYYAASADPYATVALTDCSQLDALAEAMRCVNLGETQSYDPSKIQVYEGMSVSQFYDLQDYVEQLSADEKLVEKFRTQMELAFPPEGRFHTAEFYSDFDRRTHPIHYYSGVTTSAPSTTYRTEWKATAWYAATH